MHANHELITDVLKGDMGFDGFVISDWQGIRQIPGATYADKVAAGANAGIDMFMEPYSGSDTGFREFTQTLIGLVEDGTVSMSRIDDAVSRILTAKFELGLFEHPFTDRRNMDQIGSKAHRKVARRAVAESQVLLQEPAATPCRSAGSRSRCTSPAAAPTTSASRPAAGRSPGRATPTR